MISVIVPVLNESQRVGSVVEFVRRDPRVNEVIVVDDGSTDGTGELARAAGARVIMSTLLGKGASMRDGLLAAKNDVLLYVDGDMANLRDDLVCAMTAPILAGQAEFVKARFSRSAGRVTTLTARPLLQTFFPEAAEFAQPLGGIIAARRSLLKRLQFENDYGVDVGLLLDVINIGARVLQVDIGHIDHDSQPLDILGDMATQVSRAILDRAARYQRLNVRHIREVQEVERRTQAELGVILEKAGRAERLALFDMDGVLLDGRFVVELAQITKKQDVLAAFLDHPTMPDEERTHSIGALFAGVPTQVFEQTARHMPLTPGAAECVVALRRQGYRVGIVTDSYFVAAETIRRRVFADFSVAHVMRFRGGKATGQVTLSPAMVHSQGCTEHAVCKLNVLYHLMERMAITADRVVAVGDGANDICLLRGVGKSFAYRPRSSRVREAARVTLDAGLLEMLTHLDDRREGAELPQTVLDTAGMR
jgi:phosphoserine phosphatase